MSQATVQGSERRGRGLCSRTGSRPSGGGLPSATSISHTSDRQGGISRPRGSVGRFGEIAGDVGQDDVGPSPVASRPARCPAVAGRWSVTEKDTRPDPDLIDEHIKAGAGDRAVGQRPPSARPSPTTGSRATLIGTPRRSQGAEDGRVDDPLRRRRRVRPLQCVSKRRTTAHRRLASTH